MAIQDDKTILSKQDLKEYHNRILPYLGGNMMMSTNNSEYYSTDEKVVGVWTDGKPVYQKTVACGTLPASTVSSTAHGIKNLDKVVGLSGTAVGNSTVSHMCISLPFVSEEVANKNIRLRVNLTDVLISTAIDNYASYFTAYVTIQYTKTTDTASTALTTPGAYNINFPNTWPANKEIFFGNGLYGRRCAGNLPATAVNSACTVSLFSSQSSSIKIVNMGGSFNVLGVSDNSYSLGYITQDTSPFNLITNTVLFYSSSKVMRLRIATGPYTSLTTDNTYDVWVTYTK